MERQYYLIRIQYLGFRYSGWQRQPGQKTIEGMLRKTLKFILPDRPYKLLGSSRTDARVSSLDGAFELFLDGPPIQDLEAFKDVFNSNLPPDILILQVSTVNKAFNIINDSTYKAYYYLFAYGEKLHPFCAPFMAGFSWDLDIDLMKKGASLFVCCHDFKAYTTRSENERSYVREVVVSQLKENLEFTANFFPEKSYVLEIGGAGFLRYQVRMIMGALVSLGRGEIKLAQLEKSLRDADSLQLSYIAPGSGLHLNQLKFKT